MNGIKKGNNMNEPKQKTKEWAIIDTETGEVTKTNTPVKTKEEKEQKVLDKTIKLNIEQGLINMKGIKEERHSRVYHARRLPFKNYTHKGYMNDIELLLSKHTNEISHITKQGKCFPMGHVELQDYLGIKKTAYYSFLKEAKSLGVISEATFDSNDKKRTSLIVNPAYVNNGMYLDILTFRAFEADPTFMSILTEYHIAQKERAILAIDTEE